MDARDEIKRLLNVAGEPPAPAADTVRTVWARLERSDRRSLPNSSWAWLPRGWEIAAVVVSAIGLGVITAEWRLRRHSPAESTDRQHYLAAIDPTIALHGKVNR
jgi:hypothetical protein